MASGEALNPQSSCASSLHVYSIVVVLQATSVCPTSTKVDAKGCGS